MSALIAVRQWTIVDGVVASEAQSNLFTPFFSTKPHGQGIGLTLVQEVLSAHGFDYALERTGHGTTQFSIVMESARAGSADSSENRLPRAVTGG